MDQAYTPTPRFTDATRLVEADPCDAWDLVLGDGPVLAAAIHDGHRMRDSLRTHLVATDDQLRRDEDPLTGVLTSAGDARLTARNSRFQADLNRPRDKAISSDPEDTWGMRIWRDLPEPEVEASQREHQRFYAMASALVEALLARWGCVFVLDIHSYNHRRAGAHAPPADPAGNPDIDLGVTTLDATRWGPTMRRFAQALRETPLRGNTPDVRDNVRYEGGGHFPEWLHSTFGGPVCAVSLEYKKVYMDEWTAQADIAALDDLRLGLQRAVAAVRGDFLSCR
jgi:N-formylglutamate deformylase